MASTLSSLRGISAFRRHAVSVFAGLVLLSALVAAQTPPAATFAVLHSFKGTGGEYPLSAVIMDASGNLYGTTSEGGLHGNGTVYKVTPSGEEVVLHSFKGGRSDGAFPIASLVRDNTGNLYGTTTDGGAAGFGTVFKVAEDGAETVLHSFGESADDGRYPSAGLVRDSAGNLYGTTEDGGALGFGTIFKVTESGEETVLHSFAGNPTDGQYPIANLTRDANGNLYGTTELGGSANDGTVFKLDAAGSETLLFNFEGGSTGANPFGGVIRDSSGNLYGAATYGAHGVGLVFKLSPLGVETVLHKFTGGTDGAYPSAGVIRDSSGNLFGTAEFGGDFGAGVVFEVSSSGTFSTVHSFSGSDGADILTGLLLDSAGNLYGTATEGGANGQGTVFKLSK